MSWAGNSDEPTHVPTELLARYAAGGTSTRVAHDVWWAVEAHLENCAACRDQLAAAVEQHSPATADLLERVRQDLAEQLPATPRTPVRRRRLATLTRWWAAPAMLPRLVTTVLVVLAAVALDLADGASNGRFPSLVLLLAPVAPLLGVAAAWSRGLDPAYELVVASPRAGLDLVLRRAAAVLVLVVPVLAAAGWLVGASPARWLLPCLAFTTGALALGELIGLHRAATGLALAWVAVVVGPSLVLERTPVLLAAASLPIWAVATVVVASLLILRRRAYTGLASLR